MAQGRNPVKIAVTCYIPPHTGKSISWMVTLSGWCCQAWEGLLHSDNWFLSVPGVSLLARFGAAAPLAVEAGLTSGNIRTGLVYCPAPSCNSQTWATSYGQHHLQCLCALLILLCFLTNVLSSSALSEIVSLFPTGPSFATYIPKCVIAGIILALRYYWDGFARFCFPKGLQHCSAITHEVCPFLI